MPRLTAIVPATDRPPTLARCVEAIRNAAGPPEELIVVEQPADAIPASARNLGAQQAAEQLLVFVDADVEVHHDAFSRIRRAFDHDPHLVALFGSYDDAPAAPGLVSAFRNLLHHHVHQSSAGPGTTFWTGLGAVRRDAFLAAGGFDPGLRYLEDVDLGMRLAAGGARIVLEPGIQGTHLKAWTLREMVRTDFTGRGVPWIALMLRRRTLSGALNLGWRHRLSSVACLLGLGALVTRRPGLACSAALALVVLNRSFYALLLRRRGPLETASGIGLHALHHLTGAAAVPAGVVDYLCSRSRRRVPRPATQGRIDRQEGSADQLELQ